MSVEQPGTSAEMRIAEIPQEDISAAYRARQEEGFLSAPNDLEYFTILDPHCWLGVFLNNEIVGVINVVNYDMFSALGTFIIKSSHRGKGYGRELFRKAMEHAGSRVVGLFSVEAMANHYEKLGYRRTGITIFASIIKTSGKKRSEPSNHSVKFANFEDVALDELCLFDRKYFPAERRKFLAAWCMGPGRKTAVATENGKIVGYGVIRRLTDGDSKIAPLFADSPAIAEYLLSHILDAFTGSEKIYIDVPSVNLNKISDAFTLTTACTWPFMCYGGKSILTWDGVYSNTSPDLG